MYPDALDGTRRGALAAGDLRALERRPSRARSREEAITIPENDLGVRADVHDEVDLVSEVRRLRQEHSGRVGADMTGDARKDVCPCARVDGNPDVPRRDAHRFVDRERERCGAEWG